MIGLGVRLLWALENNDLTVLLAPEAADRSQRGRGWLGFTADQIHA